MAWIGLNLDIDNKSVESVSDYLMELGAISTFIQDSNINKKNEELIFGQPSDNLAKFWKKNKVQALFDENFDIEKIKNQLKNKFKSEKLKIITSSISNQDWVKLTQSQFNPISIKNKVWIIPSWHNVIDKKAINIIIDPGRAFGTGSHATTQLCIKWLIGKVNPNSSVLDLGCGSGILSIAAKKLGARKVIGADIDSQAIKTSIENGKINKTKIEWIQSDNSIQFKGELIVANILSSSLKVLAPLISNLCKKNGSVALSGILACQENQIKEIYSEWFDFEKSSSQNGWVCISGIKR